MKAGRGNGRTAGRCGQAGAAGWALVLAGALAGCAPHPAEHGAAGPEPEPLAVRLVATALTAGERTQEFPGTVRSLNEAVLSAKIQGQVQTILVVPGRRVDAGDVLLEMDAGEIRARFLRATAEKHQAETEFQRLSRLLETEAASQREYDAATSSLRAAEAALAEAEIYLGYTTLRAPFAGIIAAKRVELGDLASPGQALLEMFDPDHFRLEVKIPESLARGFPLGHPLSARIETLETRVTGEVGEVSPLADPASRTVLVKVNLPPVPGLQSGQFGRLLLPVTDQPTLTVPPSALHRHGQLDYVFVADPAETPPRAWLRLVKTGRLLPSGREILSGLAAGEQVVAEPPPGLTDGRRILSQP